MSTIENDQAMGEEAAALAAKLSPEGFAADSRAQAQPVRPTLAGHERQQRMLQVARLAADSALGALLTSYAGAQLTALATVEFSVAEILEVRQLTAMADRMGQRALAKMAVGAEQG
jgi:hypothetical protein